jgi:hypothetical protein
MDCRVKPGNDDRIEIGARGKCATIYRPRQLFRGCSYVNSVSDFPISQEKPSCSVD